MQYTDIQLLDRLQTLPTFHGFEGIIDTWVRSRADIFDRFDDKVYTFDCTGDTPKFVMVCSGTSNAGAVGLKHFAKYNANGCAILKSDEIVYNSHVHGLHKGQYPAYVQARGYSYYRDSDKNQHADEIGKLYNDIIGANCHHAGFNSTFIGGWSVACLVRNVRAQFDNWMKFMDKRPLTVAILKEF